jgi:hypothetical protein
VGLAGIRSPAVCLPGTRSELQATVVTVTGVDLPVATALALGDAVPHGRRCCLGRCGASKPNPTGESERSARADGTLDEGGCQRRNRILPRVRLGGTRFGPSKARRSRGARDTAVSASPRDPLSSPDVREVRWFLHLRFARDVPGKAPSSGARQMDARSQQAHLMPPESFPPAFRSRPFITKRKRAAFHRRANLLRNATLCDTNL